MMTELKHILQPLVLIAALAGVYQLATAAQAMNVYNDTTLQLSVDFNCGFFCNNDWDISADDMKSRPDESGDLSASTGLYGCSVDVDTHGWVIATGSDPESIVLTSYHQDGSVRETCTFEYQPPLGQTPPPSTEDDDPEAILYVNQNVSGGNDDGSSWANAYSDIIKALAATTGETQLWVVQGTYRLSAPLSFKNSVAIYGGFVGTETSLDTRTAALDPSQTTLDGANLSGDSIVLGSESTDASAVLDGFTVTNSNTSSSSPDNGGGINNAGGSPTLNNLIISNNNANTNGGGMYSDGGQPVLTNVVFTGNTATNGGGFYNNSGAPQLNQVSFGNDTYSGNEIFCGNGGGMYVAGGAPSIINSYFTTNQISDDECSALDSTTLTDDDSLLGSGLYVASGSPILSEVAFAVNTGSSGGGGLYNAAGVVSLTGGSFSKNTVETGANGAGVYNDSGKLTLSGTVFDSNASPANGGGLYNASGSVEITGASFKFSNNSASQDGGGILNDSGQLTIDGGSFTSNQAGGNGGGLANYSGSVTFTNNASITQNSASGNGGGMYDTSSELTLATVLFENNTAGSNGGGLYYSGEIDCTFSDLKFTFNQASANGGGLYVAGSGAIAIENTQFSGNEATSNGGGLHSQDVVMSVENVTLTNNAATNGGGISVLLSEATTWTAQGTTFSQNQATSGDEGGGGAGLYIEIQSDTPVVSLERLTFKENIANARGGAIHLTCLSGTVKFPLTPSTTITNSLFAQNNGWWGGAIYSRNCVSYSTNITVVGNVVTNSGAGNVWSDYGLNSVANSILWGNTGPNGVMDSLTQSGRLFGICGGIILQNATATGPGDYETCNLKYGPYTISTQDPELDSSYQPQPGSSAVNTGYNSFVPDGSSTDLAGNKRVVGCAVDLDAYENQSDTACQAPTSAPNYNSQAWICDIGTDGKWVNRYQVRYAVSFVTSYEESSLGPWSEWIARSPYAEPTLMEIPTDPTGRATSRNVYRQFLVDYSSSDPDNGVLQIGTLDDNSTTRMPDYDAAGTTDLGGC